MISKPWLYCVALMFGSSFSFAASIESIGHFDGVPMKTSSFDSGKTTTYMQISDAKLLSADGKTVVASALNKQGGWEFYRWTKENGAEGLRLSAGGGNNAFPVAISENGNIIAGHINDISPLGAFVWTQASGPRKLINQDGKANLLAMAANGELFMGEYSADPKAFLTLIRPKKYYLYSQEKGFQLLSNFPPEATFELFSENAQVIIISFGDYGFSDVALFQIDQGENGFHVLNEFKNKTISFEGISKDGHAFTGHIYQNKNDIAFRWSQSKGLEFLGVKDRYSYPKAISADGNTVVGRAELKQGKKSVGSRAFMWTEEIGMVFLKDRLDSLGVNTQGWVLETAIGVSADGKVILGNGINPEGEKTGFIVHL